MEGIKSFVISLLVVIITLGAIAGIFIFGKNSIDNEYAGHAFCKSIDGNYGGGKCYKDGVEMKVER